MLVLARFVLVESEPPTGLLAILRNHRLFHLVLMAGVIIGIIGVTDITSSDPSTQSTGETLHKVSAVIFFVLTVLQAFQTVMLLIAEHRANAYSAKPSHRWAHRHGHYVLFVISLLLLVREVFLLATISDSQKQYNETFWYPLVALPEILAVAFYAIPGLVPSTSEIESERLPSHVYVGQ